MAARAEDLLPVEYFHVVFTVPAENARIAYWNKKAVYGLLFKGEPMERSTYTSGPRDIGERRDTDHHRRRSQASRRPDRHDQRAAHLGLGVVPKARLRPNPTIRMST